MENKEPIQRRRRDISSAIWSSLPEAVAANILARVAEVSLKNVPTLRLVSKSWRDAMWGYQGYVGAYNEGQAHPEKMRTMCKILPNASRLGIYSLDPIIMDGMRQLRRLRDVSLAFELGIGSGDTMEPPVDLSVLPPTVTKLKLDNIGLDLTTIEQIQFTLRSLQITFWIGGLDQALDLIARQLNLEELALIGSGEIPDLSISPAFESHLGRLSFLTRLEVEQVELQPMEADLKLPPNLKELPLTLVSIDANRVSELFEAAKHLTSLELQAVGVLEGQVSPDLQPICSLRRMVFCASDQKLLDVAGPRLQSLSLVGTSWPGIYEELSDVPRLSRLSGVTNLELSDYKATSHPHLASCHSLRLRELTILDCDNVEAAIFKPGALTALEVLHIKESLEARNKRRRDLRQADPAAREASERQRQEAGAVFLSLPKLRQLSGTYEAISCWMDPASQGPPKSWTQGKMEQQSIPRDEGARTISTYFRV